MKRFAIITAALALTLAALLALAPADTCPREVYEVGAVLVEIDGDVALFHDINGNLWEVDGLTPDCPERDYYQLVIDNMGTSFPEDDIILSLSED